MRPWGICRAREGFRERRSLIYYSASVLSLAGGLSAPPRCARPPEDICEKKNRILGKLAVFPHSGFFFLKISSGVSAQREGAEAPFSTQEPLSPALKPLLPQQGLLQIPKRPLQPRDGIHDHRAGRGEVKAQVTLAPRPKSSPMIGGDFGGVLYARNHL